MRRTGLASKLALALCGLAILGSGVAHGHESRPLFVEVRESDGGSFSATWRTPPSVPAFNLPEVTLAGCEATSPQSAPGAISRRLYACGDVTEPTVEIAYPVMNPSVATLLRVYRSNGESHSVLAGAEQRAIPLPAASTTAGVSREYLALGVDHILRGYDHLLFVGCLVLIAGGLRRMLITVTGFTIAHSVTLALAALDLVRLPVPPVEATIALSIVFLATELVRKRRDTLTWRFPIAVSASFGLLHGFGFASVLGEIGLPQTEIPAALLMFNVGVEVGQIAFVLFLVLLFVAGRRWLEGLSVERMQVPVGYLSGSLAAFWLVTRVAGFWGA